MRVLGDSTGIDCTSVDATLKSATSDCRYIVPTHVDVVTPHEATDFQIQPEAFAHAVCIHTNGWYEALSRSPVVDEVATITWYTAGIVESSTGVELDASVLLEMYALGCVGREKVKCLVLRRS
jgi:hypothetical protein